MSFLRSSKLTLQQQTFRSPARLRVSTAPFLNNQNNFVRNSRAFRNTSAKMVVHNITTKEEYHTTLKENKYVILDAFATWCGPCKTIAPKVVDFSNEHPHAKFVKLDVDELSEVAQELGIRAMPTFLIFKDGEKVKEVVGANHQALEAAIKEHAPADTPAAAPAAEL